MAHLVSPEFMTHPRLRRVFAMSSESWGISIWLYCFFYVVFGFVLYLYPYPFFVTNIYIVLSKMGGGGIFSILKMFCH